jgi:hypothetical protein
VFIAWLNGVFAHQWTRDGHNRMAMVMQVHLQVQHEVYHVFIFPFIEALFKWQLITELRVAS